MTSAKNSKCENFVGEDTPRPPYKVRAFGTRDNALPHPPATPVTKNLATALRSLNIADTERSRKQYGRKNIPVILAARVRKKLNDTQRAILFSWSATGTS